MVCKVPNLWVDHKEIIKLSLEVLVDLEEEEEVEIMAAKEVAATAEVIALTLINPLEQKGGKTEVMEILLKILNMKMVGAGEKGEFPTRAMLQTRQISNPFLQVLALI